MTERGKVDRALLDENVLARGAIIFSGEAERQVSWLVATYMMTRSSVRVDFLEVPPKLDTMFSIGMLTKRVFD